MAVVVRSSQESDIDSEAPAYTSSPLGLCWSDLLLFIKNAWAIPGVFLPLTNATGPLDEFYPSASNLVCLSLHLILLVIQSIFLISLPFCTILPLGLVVVYVGAVMLLTAGISRILNGGTETLHSTVDLGNDAARHSEECWIFCNGICAGGHWLQSNVDRLSYTFRRPIIGVHNRTRGFLFDLIECVIERNFCFATLGIRKSYAVIRNVLDEKYKKVVLILHSQGGIEGGLILDWLLDQVPEDALHKLEIYTFGSAANHFNDPRRNVRTQGIRRRSNMSTEGLALRHIEHYANEGEFVARWGVLGFTTMKDRYMGRVFIRKVTGHMFNQHYLNDMFPLGPDKRVLDSNEFMDTEIEFSRVGARKDVDRLTPQSCMKDGERNGEPHSVGDAINDSVSFVTLTSTGLLEIGRGKEKPKAKQLSRLWQYRNGLSPEEMEAQPLY